MIHSTVTSFQTLPKLPGYTLTEQIYLGNRVAVYRAIQTTTQQPVVIKVLRCEYPSFRELAQFRNQYTIAQRLPLPGIVQPLRLEPVGNGYALVMDDWGGIALSQYTQFQPLPWPEVLTIALQLADILHGLSQHGVIHKDIKPANILIHPESKQIKLIDFSIASLLPKETQTLQSPGGLEGTLAYMAPEQTGRMSRGIDYRADFYALGVTLYQLLTGTLPFTAEDPLTLIHCHMAQMPVPVNHVNPSVPEIVAAIVAKLMAKNAEDRYQSALGLKYDMQQCLQHWQETGTIVSSPLAERDVNDRFLIPEKLYGREVEVNTLLTAFERVATGTSELMLVAGFSGIGKTAVVNEIHKPILRQRGYFSKGKFDQFNRSVPLSAFVQALRDLMKQLLSESDAQLAHWQADILAAVGENGQILIEVIPELEQIIGSQPPAPELSGNAAQSRFNRLFQKFIQVFTKAEHPLVLFLDDLQWADLASLHLLTLLMEDNGHLLVIGAYRDNEVSPTHPLTVTVDELRKAQKTVNTLTLQPLSFKDTNALIADTLHCPFHLATPLTQLIDRKTQGNPFFTTQFLKVLHDDGHIYFDRQRGYWVCNIAQVNALTITNDVVEFMAAQLQKLPPETQAVLKLAACVGNQFDLVTLAIVAEQETKQVANALWAALQEGLIIPTSRMYQFFHGQQNKPPREEEDINLTYCFLHDRVQQAAYSLIPEAQKQDTHYRIGQLLRASITEAALDSQIFRLISQLNAGIDRITTPAEHQELARLNLLAGQKSHASSAYDAAFNYCAIGISLLQSHSWETDYSLTLNLYELAAESCFLSGHGELLENYAIAILNHVQTPLDRLKITEIRIQAYTVQNRLTQAIDIAKQALQELGVVFPDTITLEDIQKEFQAVQSHLATLTLEQVATLPKMTDPVSLAVMRLLKSIVATAYIADPNLFPLVVFRMVQWSLNYGNAPASPFAYAGYGILLVNIAQDTTTVIDIGKLALKLLEDGSDQEIEAKTRLVVGSSLYHWKVHVNQGLPLAQASYQIALDVGDLEYAGYSAQIISFMRYFMGHSLMELEPDIHAYCQEFARLDQVNGLRYCQIYRQVVLNLLGETDQPTELVGEAFNQHDVIPRMFAASDWTGLLHVYCNQLILHYYFGNIDAAVAAAAQAKPYENSLVGMFFIPTYYFYATLALLKVQAPFPVNTSETSSHWQQVAHNLARLKAWAESSPSNYQHRLDLAEAEYYRVTSQPYSAMEAYDRAITGANTHGYLQEEGLANELAARFYLDRGKEKIAAAYLQDAYYCYARWGAKAKIDDLEQRYPTLLAPILHQQTSLSSQTGTLQPRSTTTLHPPITHTASLNSTISSTLDLPTILKASQTLSSVIELDKLLATLLDIVLQNAGADKVALLLPQEQEWFVEAIASLEEPAQVVSIPLGHCKTVSHTLIHHTQRSQDPLVIMDAVNHPLLTTDAYVIQHQPKSLLCTPIINQGKLVAILYLENRLATGVFTRDRIDLLNFLCAQAAISLENARLYQQSQHYTQQLEQSLHELNVTQSRFHNLVDNVPGVVYQLHQHGDGSASMVYISNDCYELYGITADDITANAQILLEIVHPEDASSFYQEIEQSLSTLRKFQWEGRIITPAGVTKWIRSEAKLTQLNTDTIVWDGLVVDISDRKQADLQLKQQAEDLQRSQQLLQLVFDTLPQRIFWKDKDLRYLGCNQLFLQDAGLTDQSQIIGKTDYDMSWHLNAEMYHADDAAVIASETPRINFEEPQFKEDGSTHWLRTSKIPLRDLQGHVIGVFGSYEDITALKQAEDLLKQQKRDLETALAQLQQTQLQMVQSEKMASLGNLVAGVAHEINNPIGFLNGSIDNARGYVQDLLGHIDLYQKHHPDAAASVQENADDIDLEFIREDLPKLLDSMRCATDRIKAISTSLRTFSRADTEYKVQAHIHEGMDSTLLILKYRLKANTSRPEIIVQKEYGDIPPIECFPGQLNQVFMNILANAIDMFDEAAHYTTFAELKCNPQVITIRTTLADNRSIEIRIRDNGIGMTDEVKARAFEHLFTTKGVGKGTGLGLAIARQIVVEKHGGSLELQSQLGQGTEFYIRLPIVG